MSRLLDQLISITPPFNMIILLVVIMGFGSALNSLMKQVRKYACHRQELDFKRELVDRGLSPEEVGEIIRARGPEGTKGVN